MTATLQITDGTTTVDLNGTNSTGAAAFKDYVPRPPAKDRLSEGVTETARVRCRDTSVANVLATIRLLEKLLEDAAIYAETKRGVPVYVKFKPEGSEAQQRSQILAGELDYDKAALDYAWQVKSTPVAWVDVMWTRVSYWEADSETQVALLNGSVGGKTTNALALYNHDDATTGHDNYAEIAAADVIGSVPAACRLEITNTFATGNATKYYAALGAYADVGTLVHILEGEDATLVGGSDADEATCSGTGGAGGIGQYAGITGITAAEVRAAIWAISAAQAVAMAGQFFRVFARFKTLPAATITVRLGTYLTGDTTLLYASEPRLLSASQYLQEIGTIHLPPWLKSLAGSAAFDLALCAKKPGGSGTLDLDFIALLPCDSFRTLSAVALGAPQNDVVKDDGIIGETWQETSGAKTGRWVGYGDPLMLVPGRKQRIYLFAVKSDGTAEILRTQTLKVYYRPRKLTL
jgi:hypothetical protein